MGVSSCSDGPSTKLKVVPLLSWDVKQIGQKVKKSTGQRVGLYYVLSGKT